MHAVVWVDPQQARIVRYSSDDLEKKSIDAAAPQRSVHPRNHPIELTKVRDNREYFEAILSELADVDAWLIAGPAKTGLEFEKYVRVGHAEELARRLLGVETMESANDGALLDCMQRRLKAA